VVKNTCFSILMFICFFTANSAFASMGECESGLSDDEYKTRIIGKWQEISNIGFESSITFYSNGTYRSTFSQTYPSPTQKFHTNGAWQIKNGAIIYHVDKSGLPPEFPPEVIDGVEWPQHKDVIICIGSQYAKFNDLDNDEWSIDVYSRR